MTAAELGAELGLARDAALEAGRLMTQGIGADRVREKARADLVTDVDEAAERLIAERIRQRFPDDRIIGEEFSGGSAFAGRSWVVDPVDGTVNFVHGHPFTCVSIALWDDAGPAVAVIHAPFLGESYHAVRGGGAYLNGRPLHVSLTERGEAGLYATGFPFKAGKGDPEVYLRLVGQIVAEAHGVRRAGSAALDLAFVAAGRLDGYFEIGLARWDIGAGILLVLQAGGKVTGWPGDADPPMNTGRILATNGRVHPWLTERVARFVPPL